MNYEPIIDYYPYLKLLIPLFTSFLKPHKELLENFHQIKSSLEIKSHLITKIQRISLNFKTKKKHQNSLNSSPKNWKPFFYSEEKSISTRVQKTPLLTIGWKKLSLRCQTEHSKRSVEYFLSMIQAFKYQRKNIWGSCKKVLKAYFFHSPPPSLITNSLYLNYFTGENKVCQ